MKRGRLHNLVLGFALLLATSLPGFAEKPTWAKKSRAFPSECRERSDFAKCRPLRIPSPDGKSVVAVSYLEKGDLREAFLRVATSDGRVRETAPPWGFQDLDLLWSPDSRAFFLNGGNGGGYWGFFVYVFRLDDPKLEPVDVTQEARGDMLRLFPPCKAAGIEQTTCKQIEADPQDLNRSGIDWVRDSSAIAVMVEVPCSGTHGGIMCQVMGYELEVPTGRILKRMDARQLKMRWQSSMAFKLSIPDPPRYADTK